MYLTRISIGRYLREPQIFIKLCVIAILLNKLLWHYDYIVICNTKQLNMQRWFDVIYVGMHKRRLQKPKIIIMRQKLPLFISYPKFLIEKIFQIPVVTMEDFNADLWLGFKQNNVEKKGCQITYRPKFDFE